MPKDEFVTIEVFNSIGQNVATLMNEHKNAGEYKVIFDGRNFSSGMYFYRIEAGNFTETKKMLLIR